MEELIREMLSKKIWAVVGATDNKEKFGYKIYRKLKDFGYKVYPVNPNYNEVDGDKCYRSIKDLPEIPEVIDMVVSPKIGLGTLQEAAELGIKFIWFQPGAQSEEPVKYAMDRGIQVVYERCVLIELNKK